MSIPTQGELKIFIQMPNGSGGNNTANGQEPSATNPQHDGGGGVSNNPKNGDIKSSITMAAAVNGAMQVGKQAVSSGVSVIGIATGNYYAQARAQQAMQTISSVAQLGATLASGNPLLIGVTVAGMAISTATELYQQKREREIANYEAEQYAKRIGYTVGRR